MKLHCARNRMRAQRKQNVPKNIPLTLACGNYEIVRALQDGTVKPDGIDLTILTDMDSTTRHWRFLREGHFDVAETSCSSYIVARDKGMAITAIPVFLHRRFRHGFVFINTTQGHQEADRPDRQEDRHQVVPGDRDPLDARHPRTRIRRVAQIGRMGRRARRGRRLHAAAGPQDHPPAARQVGRGHAGGGRGRCADPLRHHQADGGRRSARRRGCGRTTRPRKSASTRRRRFSRSCT